MTTAERNLARVLASVPQAVRPLVWRYVAAPVGHVTCGGAA